ncbi:MAG: class I tRNA ligase family protein, partial [Candidatus Caldatribacteriaceae bacterium]
MEKSFYITTPIYYVNDVPHIGHAYTTCAADILARFHRLRGERVLFSTGTDEHGQKIEKAAHEAGLTPRELVDKVVVRFQELWKVMHIEYDVFIRTTSQEHEKVVQDFFLLLKKKGYVYKGEYEGWYCVPCETFWPEGQLDERLVCPDCGRPLQKLKEESHFFALSRFTEPLLRYLEEHPDFVMPESRYN